ncbi:MAG: hypothetical protein ACRBCS_12215 [Cellvibrionaceae bacterium]
MGRPKTKVEVDTVETAEKDFFGSKDDRPEDRTVTSRARIRQELTDQMEAFLATGGQIANVANGITADPPKKPTSNYGSRPI